MRLRSNLISNVDLKPVSAEERELGELLGKYQDAKARTPEVDWYGTIRPDRMGRTIIAEKHLKLTPDAINRMWAEGKSFGPIGVDPEGRPVFPEATKEAVRLGYVCPKCWQRQAFPNLATCQIKGKDYGCNYTRSLSGY